MKYKQIGALLLILVLIALFHLLRPKKPEKITVRYDTTVRVVTRDVKGPVRVIHVPYRVVRDSFIVDTFPIAPSWN